MELAGAAITDKSELNITHVIASVLSISLSGLDPELSFQELGGTSLNAIITALQLKNVNIHVSVPDILQSSSLREMVPQHSSATVVDAGPPLPFSLLPKASGLDLATIEDAYLVTPLQESIIADSLLERANYIYQRVCRIRGVTPSQVRPALEAVIARNSILRITFVPWK